jgi:hypothetical protein
MGLNTFRRCQAEAKLTEQLIKGHSSSPPRGDLYTENTTSPHTTTSDGRKSRIRKVFIKLQTQEPSARRALLTQGGSECDTQMEWAIFTARKAQAFQRKLPWLFLTQRYWCCLVRIQGLQSLFKVVTFYHSLDYTRAWYTDTSRLQSFADLCGRGGLKILGKALPVWEALRKLAGCCGWDVVQSSWLSNDLCDTLDCVKMKYISSWLC